MAMNDKDLKKNGSGCPDPVAFEAISKVMNESKQEAEEARFHKLLHAIFDICDLSGFHLEERIIVKDKKTGKIWR